MMWTVRGSVRMRDSLEAMERDAELDRTGEGEGRLEVQRPCRGQRGGAWGMRFHIWRVGHRRLLDTLRGMEGHP